MLISDFVKLPSFTSELDNYELTMKNLIGDLIELIPMWAQFWLFELWCDQEMTAFFKVLAELMEDYVDGK